jgi:hypothetical protein
MELLGDLPKEFHGASRGPRRWLADRRRCRRPTARSKVRRLNGLLAMRDKNFFLADGWHAEPFGLGPLRLAWISGRRGDVQFPIEGQYLRGPGCATFIRSARPAGPFLCNSSTRRQIPLSRISLIFSAVLLPMLGMLVRSPLSPPNPLAVAKARGSSVHNCDRNESEMHFPAAISTNHQFRRKYPQSGRFP